MSPGTIHHGASGMCERCSISSLASVSSSRRRRDSKSLQPDPVPFECELLVEVVRKVVLQALQEVVDVFHQADDSSAV